VAGLIEPGETPERAGLRELAEEAGLVGHDPRLVATEALDGDLIIGVACDVEDAPIATTGHSEIERTMGLEIEFAVPDPARIVPDSAASRLVQRLLSGEFARIEARRSPAVDRRDRVTGKATFTIGAFGIARDAAGRILLCRRRDNGKWNLPGGAVDHGESAWDAAIREVREETGFEVRIERLLGVYWKSREADVVLVFRCEVLSGAPTTSDESSEVAFFPLDHLPVDLPTAHRERIDDAITGADMTYLRARRYD
jgi:ADP-ribose pyrophosphatase YjhB (NUDIX family)